MSRLHIRLLVQSDAFAGVERYLTYVAPELVRRGHQVAVVGGEPAAMRRALEGTGVSFTPASSLADVRREAWRGPVPDVLHSHMTAADLAAVGPAWARRCPLVSTLHFGGGRGHSTLTRLAYQALRAGVAADVAVSRYVAQTSPGHPRVVTMGIPAPALVELPTTSAREHVVLMAQRLETEKATDVGIRAWARSGLAERGWRLEVAGRGAQRAALEALAAELGATDSIDFVGHDPDPAARMARASILLAPRPDEAFGLTVVEAMSLGLPVVAAAGGGHLETVGPVSADTLFAPGDVDAAADRLAGLAEDAPRRDALGVRLAARYHDTYRIDQHAERLEVLYGQVMAGGRRRLRAGQPERPAVALAHDYLTQRGGAERVVVALEGVFPQAAIHTTVYEPAGTFSAFRRAEVHTTALQRVGALRRNPRLALPVLAPLVSHIHVDAEVTVCSSTGWAHGVQTTGAKVLYIHNTARWLYQRDEYLDGLSPWYRLGLMPMIGPLRRWDQRAAASADVILVNSAITQARVLRHWGLRSEILHPPPGLGRIGAQRAVDGLEPGFLLTVSRLLPYKRIGAVLGAVGALSEAGKPGNAAEPVGPRGERLVVVGSGPDRARLESVAPPGTVFLGEVPDDQLRWLFANAEALVTAAHDDFGLTPLESMQFGTPVVAVREGGFPETVVDGETGVLFDGATADDVRRGLVRLRSRPWDRRVVEARAADFSAEAFAARIQAVVDELLSTRPNR